MKSTIFILCFVMLSRPCWQRAASSEEESVVSVYTTQPTTTGTSKPLDVYQQIATNIASKITSPIYRFLGIGANKTADGVKKQSTTKKPWSKLELIDDGAEEVTKAGTELINNEIEPERDVEELSDEIKRKFEKKPEKVVLYSSYLPVFNEKLAETNSTANGTEDDDDFGFGLDDDIDDDDDNEGQERQNPFTTFLEFIASYLQLILGGLAALLTPRNRMS